VKKKDFSLSLEMTDFFGMLPDHQNLKVNPTDLTPPSPAVSPPHLALLFQP